MGGKVVDRRKMAQTFRLKSDDSYKAAQVCLEWQVYRAACNRSWYSVMQIITAATYEDTNDQPGNDRPNWSHERQSIMFRNLARKHKVWEEYKALAIEIDMMRERRNDADYLAPNELYANGDAAQRSLETAAKVRSVIFQLIGSRWDQNATNR